MADDRIRELEQRLAALDGDFAKYRRDQRYTVETQGQKRTWQDSAADNVDATHSITLELYIPTTVRLVRTARLRFKLKAFRSYGTGAASANLGTVSISTNTTRQSSTTTTGPSSTTTTGASSATTTGPSSTSTTAESRHEHTWGETNTASADGTVGAHVHGITIDTTWGNPGHSHGMDHTHTLSHTHDLDHTHTLSHTHGIDHSHTIGSHTHNLTHGIYEGTSATNVTVTINGTDRTAALDGGAGFTTDQDDLDIAQYLTATGWNTITLSSTQLGRIHAAIFVELYMP